MRKKAFSTFHVKSLKYLSKVGLFALLIGFNSAFSQLVAVDDTLVALKTITQITFDPTTNDNLINLSKTQVTIVSGPNNGTSLLSGNMITYTPENDINGDDFEGRDTINYRICDTSLTICERADIIYEIGKVPYFPLALDDTLIIGQNDTIIYDVLTNDTATTIGSMAIEIIDQGDLGGSAILVGTEIQYIPATDYVGNDTITYTYCDVFDFYQGGIGEYCDTANMTVTINSLHTIKADPRNEYTLTQPQLSLETIDITTNYDDLEGDSLIATNFLAEKLTYNISSQTFTYTPGEDFTGLDTLVFDVCDTIGQCVQDTFFVEVLPEILNPRPIVPVGFIRDSIYIGETKTITIDATDDQPIFLDVPTNFSELQFSGFTGDAGDLTFSYSPTISTSGVDTFQINVCEVDLPTNCSNVSFIITIIDSAAVPVANDDFVTILENDEIEIEIFENDEINGSQLVFLDSAANGTMSLDFLGKDGILTYTPNEGFYGNDTITYQLCRDSCDDAEIIITVEPIFEPVIIEGVSPNGDGINDVFTIQDVDYDLMDITVKIYNRWGTPIYTEQYYDANDEDKSWRGQTDIGADLVDGTYFYLVKIPELDFEKSGSLVLINNK